MAWRIVIQPNGLFARFSDIVDDFTDYDMTEGQALMLCQIAAGDDVAETKIIGAKEERGWGNEVREPGTRFRESIQTIRNVHGDAEAQEREAQLSADPAGEGESKGE